jgi:ABC-type Zn uptake system ZnuABC Zn-binding protein ZnuA
MFRSLKYFALAALLALSAACSTVAPPAGTPAGNVVVSVDPVATIQTGVALTKATVDALVLAGKIKPADVAKFNAEADAVLAIVSAIGPVASLADPKLAPAFAALTALQSAVALAKGGG